MKEGDLQNKKIEEILRRGTTHIIPEDEVIKKLTSNKKLRIKHGVDPTTPDLHLGYSVVYLKLRELQKLGHTIVFLIGDFTGRFGDPSGKERSRKLRTKKELQPLVKNYLNQVTRILSKKGLEIRYNSEWYDKMGAEELLQILTHFTTGQLMERDMFRERQKRGAPIYAHEPLYPVLQAYDSVMLKSDLTIIGNDQIFNEGLARGLQRTYNQEPQGLIATELLIGTDGSHKMSQSTGNDIKITDSPKDMFGKIMSIPDTLIEHYYKLVTRVPLERVKKISEELTHKEKHPKDAKYELAEEIVSSFYSKKEAREAREEFIRVFSKGKDPKNTSQTTLPYKKGKLYKIVVDTGLTSSNSAAKRLIEDGAVKVGGITISDPHKEISINKEMLLRVGKHKFTRIVSSK